MANPPSPTPVMGGLTYFDLSTIFRCAVELAEAVASVSRSEWAGVPLNIEGPASPYFERWRERHRRIRRIEEESERLKRSLGAAGPLGYTDGEDDADPQWDSYDQRFNNTVHDRVVRLALVKLATAAIDLSGFATWRDLQWAMREMGLRLLTWGLAQLWEGMSDEERSKIRDRLPRTNKAVGWPADPATNPPTYDGPDEIPLPDQYRIVTKYVSCTRDYLDDVQKANSMRAEQGQERFLRRASVCQFADAADRAAQALKPMAAGDYDTPEEWGNLYLRVFSSLACLRKANEVGPRETWPAETLAQRHLLADAAGRLIVWICGDSEAKKAMKPEDADKAFAEFMATAGRLRAIADREIPCDSSADKADPMTKPATPPTGKRSTERGGGRTKLIAALTKHHQYADNGCLNLEPIGNNDLAKAAGVAPSTASTFFNREFQDHAKYQALCRDSGRLAAALKLLNGEFAPHNLYGGRPPDEDDRDDE